jgi:hypothetical protein
MEMGKKEKNGVKLYISVEKWEKTV